MNNDDKPIIVEQTYDSPIDTVWKAITEIDQMRQWFFGSIEDFKPEVGFETTFNVESESRDFLHKWRVTEVAPMKRISYAWKYDGIPGDSTVVFELFEEDGRTKLTLTHSVLEGFPTDIPEFSRENGVAGWEYFIQQSLKDYLKKTL